MGKRTTEEPFRRKAHRPFHAKLSDCRNSPWRKPPYCHETRPSTNPRQQPWLPSSRTSNAQPTMQRPIANNSTVSSRSALTRSRYYRPLATNTRLRMLMRCDSLTSSRTTRPAVLARTPAPGDGTRMSVWVSVPPRPPLRAPTSTRRALSPAWSPSVAVSSPVPSCPPRCTVRFPGTPKRARRKNIGRGRGL